MKFSRREPERTASATCDNNASRPRGLAARSLAYLRQVRSDLYGPLPEAQGRPFSARLKTRLGRLRRNYGWKLLLIVLVYYAVRDITVYVLIPYFVARKLIGN